MRGSLLILGAAALWEVEGRDAVYAAPSNAASDDQTALGIGSKAHELRSSLGAHTC